MADSILTRGQRRLHAAILALSVFMIGNAAYLLVSPPSESVLPYFYQSSLVAHVAVGTLLLFEPRRWRVYLAKLFACAIGIVAAGVVMYAWLIATMWLASAIRGSTVAITTTSQTLRRFIAAPLFRAGPRSTRGRRWRGTPNRP